MKLDIEKYSEIIRLPIGKPTGLFCEECGAELIVRKGYSKFLGCSGYPICKNTYSLSNPISFNSSVGRSNFRHLDGTLFEDNSISKMAYHNNGHCSPEIIDVFNWAEGLSPIMCKDDLL